MKKIIATVLAMVMALALCTTAFAAGQEYDVFDKDGNKGEYTVTVSYTKADADANTIAYYTLDDGQNTNGYENEYYVKVSKASDADLVLKYAGKSTVAMNRKRRTVIIDGRYRVLVFFWRLIPRRLWKRLPVKTKS